MFNPVNIWSTNVSAFSGDIFYPDTEKQLLALNRATFRWRERQRHTVADPFLVVSGGRLWLFVESQRYREKGKIVAYSSDDLASWSSHGVVLDEKFHLSYPQVISEGGIWRMVPECAESGGVWMYEADSMPGPWRRARKLLDAPHWDPTIHKHEDYWYLWATDSAACLRLYISSAIEGPYHEHPSSPVTSDKRYARCGGSPLRLPCGALVRLAQDGSRSYGYGLHALSIEMLNPFNYREVLFRKDFLPRSSIWNRNGTHHLSIVEFKGIPIRAVDGQASDLALNFIPRIIWRLARLIKQR